MVADLGLREWLLIIGGLLILGILLHGWFRARRSRSGVGIKLDKRYLSKLGDEEDQDDVAPMDSAFTSDDVKSDVASSDVAKNEGAGKDGAGKDGAGKDGARSRNVNETAKSADNSREVFSRQEASQDESIADKMLVLHLVAGEVPFAGQKLIETLLEVGMTFGDMDIFHYSDARGQRIFSLANAVEPGTFDMAKIDSFSTQGLTLFMFFDEPEDPLMAFELVIDVATRLASQLAGELADENRSALTVPVLEALRQKIRDHVRNQSAGTNQLDARQEEDA